MGGASGVRIQLFGSLAVEVDGNPEVPISSRVQRELFSILAVNAPKVVSTDAIIEALWPQEASDRLPALHVHVSGLRKTLDPTSRSRIVETRPPGYVLGVDHESVDIHQFVAAVVEAQETARRDEIRGGKIAERALALWASDPFKEFEYSEWAVRALRPLDEFRLNAIDLRNAAAITAGTFTSLIPDMRRQVEEHPLRESFWAHLMSALYLSGRQPDALHAFQDATAAFAEVGTAPSRRLEALEEAILLRNMPIPNEGDLQRGGISTLPTPVSSFVGRVDDVAALQDTIEANRLVTVAGLGGIGKTRVALESTKRLDLLVPDGAWFVDLSGIGDESLLVPRIAATLGVVPSPGETLMDGLLGFLRDRRLLVLLDDCDPLGSVVGLVVEQILRSCPFVNIVATSRQPLNVLGEAVFHIGPLSIEPPLDGGPSEAVLLFLDRARSANPRLEVSESDFAAVGSVCSKLAGIPLALEIAAARTRAMSVHTLAARLDDQPTQPDPLWLALDWSYQMLDAGDQRVFRELSVFSGGFMIDNAESLDSMRSDPSGHVLDRIVRLVDASMVTRVGDQYSLLGPLRAFGSRQADSHDELAVLRDLHASVYSELFHVPDTTLFEFGDAASFEPDIDNARAALAWSIDLGESERAVRLGAVFCSVLVDLGLLAEASSWLRRFLEMDTAASASRARALYIAALVAFNLEGMATAAGIVSQLSETADEIDDDLWRAVAKDHQGHLALVGGRFNEAIDRFESAASDLRQASHPEWWHPMMSLLLALNEAGRFPDALAAADQIEEWGLRVKNQDAVDKARHFSAYVAINLGDAELASTLLPRLDEPGLSATQNAYLRVAWGSVALLRDDLDAAESLGFEAVEGARVERDPDSFYEGLVLIGLVRFDRRDFGGAKQVLLEALSEAIERDHVGYIPYVLAPLGAVLAMSDDPRGSRILDAVEAHNLEFGYRMPAALEAAMRSARDAGNDGPARAGEDQAQSPSAISINEAAALARATDD